MGGRPELGTEPRCNMIQIKEEREKHGGGRREGQEERGGPRPRRSRCCPHTLTTLESESWSMWESRSRPARESVSWSVRESVSWSMQESPI